MTNIITYMFDFIFSTKYNTFFLLIISKFSISLELVILLGFYIIVITPTLAPPLNLLLKNNDTKRQDINLEKLIRKFIKFLKSKDATTLLKKYNFLIMLLFMRRN